MCTHGRKLIATGNVRAGLTVPLRRQLFALLQPLKTARCPFANLPNVRKSHWYEGITAEDMTKITWLKPKVVTHRAFLSHGVDRRTVAPPCSVRRSSAGRRG